LVCPRHRREPAFQVLLVHKLGTKAIGFGVNAIGFTPKAIGFKAKAVGFKAMQ